MDRSTEYTECNHIKRPVPNYTIDDELKREIAEDYRTIPQFEKTTFEHIHINFYSLQRNELLKCRWEQYKNLTSRVFAPFQFPCPRDLHFYNHEVRFVPSISPFRKAEYRMKLKPGPGVDHIGQMPIPFEMYMKRL